MITKGEKREKDINASLSPSDKKLRDAIEYDIQNGKTFSEIIRNYSSFGNANKIDGIIKELEKENADRILSKRLGVSFEKKGKSVRNR